MKRKIYLVIGFLLLAGTCFGVEPPHIVSPTTGTVVSPGQTISITVTADPSMRVVSLATDLGQASDSSRDSNSRTWHFSLTIPPKTRIGQYEISAIGSQEDRDPIGSDAIILDVESALNATAIAPVSGQLELSPGDGLPIAVMATFSDNSQANVSESSKIKFSSTNTAVATVAASGVVTAVAIGKATINISYGSLSTQVSITVKAPDASILFWPSVSAVASPLPNAAHWNNTDVGVSLTAKETMINTPQNGESMPTLVSIGYVLEGAMTGKVSFPGGSSTSLIVSAEGITDVNYGATDSAGAVESGVLEFQIDKTPPVISGSFAPAPNASGWNNTQVIVTFTCADALSGLAPGFPPAPTLVSTDGLNQQVTGSCQDLAGNIGSGLVAGINIDTTAPNAYNVFAPSSLDVAVYGKDALSGVAPGALVPTSDVTTTSGDGDHDRDDRKYELRTFQFSDLAGNQTILTEKIGKRDHSVSASLESIQYGSAAVVRLPHNRETFEWTLNSDGSLKELRQELSVDREGHDHHAEAFYNSADNKTVIREEGFEHHEEGRNDDDHKIVKTGLVLLHMTTQDGRLHIEF